MIASLGLGWRFVFKISNQDNADSPLVVFRDSRMCSLHLLPPAKRRFDLTIGHSISITDHKVITDSQPVVSAFVLPLQMFFMNAFDATSAGRRMMQHDIVPVSCFGVRLPGIAAGNRFNWLVSRWNVRRSVVEGSQVRTASVR